MTEAAATSTDRGYAWVILAAAFGIQLLAIGEARSFGFLYTEFLDRFQRSAGSTAWIISLNFALLDGTGLISSAIRQAITYRLVLIISGVVIVVEFVCSAFVSQMEILYITYGVLTGIGFGFSYTPTLVMVSMYFEKRRALANGITVAGSRVGYFLWPFLHRSLLAEYNLFGTLFITGAICLNVCVLGLLIRPVPAKQITNKTDTDIVEPLSEELDEVDVGNTLERDPNLTNRQRIDYGAMDTKLHSPGVAPDNKINDGGKGHIFWTIFNKFIPDCTLLSNQIFWVYLVAYSFSSFGHYSNLMVVPPFATNLGVPLDSVATIISMSALADVCGRVVIGWVSDMQCLNRRYIFALCMAVSGLSSFVAPFATSFATIVIYGICFGFFAGSFWAMAAVLLADAFRKERLPAAIGLLISLISIPTLLASPFFGWLKDLTGDWSLSFIMAGISMLLSAICIMIEPLARRLNAGTYSPM